MFTFTWYSTICFWIDIVWVYNFTKFKGLDSREIASFLKSKNVMNMTGHFNRHQKKAACSSQDSFAYNKQSLQHMTS